MLENREGGYRSRRRWGARAQGPGGCLEGGS